MIFLGLIVGLIYIFGIKRLIIINNPGIKDEKNIEKILIMGMLHTMFAFIIFGHAKAIDPIMGDNIINSILEDTFVGDIVGFFTDVDTTPNFFTIAMAEKIKESAVVFCLLVLIIALIEGFGLIGRIIDRWLIEFISIICTICCFLFQIKMLNFQVDVLANSKIEGLLNSVDVSLMSSVSWFKPLSIILFLSLIINHFIMHFALNKYYGSEGFLKLAKVKIVCLIVGSTLSIFLFNKFMLNPDLFADNFTTHNIQKYVEEEPSLQSEQEIIFEKLGDCSQVDVSPSQQLSLYIKEDIAPADEWNIGVNSLWMYNQKNKNLTLIARSGETIIEKIYKDETRTSPINAIDIAKVLPQNKLFISGCPDGRNVESYIYDIETKKAIFLYGSFHGITENELLIVEQYKITIDKGRCPFLFFYDLNGNCVKSIPLEE